MKIIARAAIIGVICTFATGALAVTPDQINQARARGLAWLIANQGGDGSWKNSSGLKIQPTTMVLDAFLNSGIKQGYPFAAGVAWLANTEALSVDSIARQSRTLYRCGENVDALMGRLNIMVHSSSKSWGAYANYYGSFPDTSLAVDAVLTANTSTITYLSTSASFITGKQIANNNGWAYTSIEPVAAQNRLIPTAYNIITLSHYKIKSSGVDSNISRAVTWLLSQQKSDGGFADDPIAVTGNIHETALAYLSLNEAKLAGNAAAGCATATMVSAQDFVLNRQQPDGSWGEEPLQTALALQTLPTVQLPDTDMDGLPDVVETILGTNPVVADARAYLKITNSSKLAVTPPSDSLGNLFVNGSVSKSFVLANSGNIPLVIGKINLAGDQGFSKSVDACSGMSISPMANCTVRITFTPKTAGLAIANLIIPSNDIDTPTTYVSLNGIGIQPVLSLAFSGTGGGTISASPNNVNCSGNCIYTYLAGTTVTLAASPNPISSFSVWSGAGCGSNAVCTFILNSDTTVTANFVHFADFSITPPGGVAPLTVQFAGLDASATSWSWDFGDGTTSTAQRPSHLYPKPGAYTVKLTAANSQRSASYSKKLYVSDLTPILMLLLE